MKTAFRFFSLIVLLTSIFSCKNSDKELIQNKISKIESTLDSFALVLKNLPDTTSMERYNELQQQWTVLTESGIREIESSIKSSDFGKTDKKEFISSLERIKKKINLLWLDWYNKKFGQLIKQNIAIYDKLKLELMNVKSFPKMMQTEMELQINTTLLNLETTRINLEEVLKIKTDSLKKYSKILK